jgi:hypothetical protein
MSTTTLDATAAEAPLVTPAEPGVTTFRGRTLEELLPQIREQLGPDAVVIRQRDGLMGGIGGFFQQRFVEVDARAGHARVDVYDEQPAPAPESFAELLADAEADDQRGPRVTVAPTDPDPRSSTIDAETLPLDADLATPAPAIAHEPTVAEAVSLDAQATAAPALTDELTRTGMSASFAGRLVADAEAHELPFADDDLRTATRRALARRIPTSLPHRAGGLAVAFAGPGSTTCADALATAYKRAGRDARAIATLDQARTRIGRGNPDQVIALDLPPIATDRQELTALAERVRALELDELLIVLPADLDLPSSRALVDRLQPLSPTAVALILDDCDAQLGAALELACTTRLPIAYVHDAHAGIVPVDPTQLAERLLP